MFSSLPDYRRFAESALPRLRKDHERETSNRIGGMAFNIILLAGLWGVPLYARWMILSDRNPTQNLSTEVLGKWRKDDSHILEFTRRGELLLILIRNKVVVESADYRIAGDVLEVSGFTQQPENRLLPVNQQRYQLFLRGDRLLIKPATTGFTSIPERASEGSGLRLVLPPWSGVTVQFQRVDD